MHRDSRLASARLAYQRALVAARVAPTPRRWRKLVAAAKGLRAAHRLEERRRLAALPLSARRLAVAPWSDGLREAELLPFPASVPRWPEGSRRPGSDDAPAIAPAPAL